MQIKLELLKLLIAYGMTAEEINELAGRLVGDAQQHEAAKAEAEGQLAHNADVKNGLLQTIAEAEAKAARARKLVSYITEPAA